jgi:hypothetical protein
MKFIEKNTFNKKMMNHMLIHKYTLIKIKIDYEIH